MTKHILITGCGGFLGSHAVRSFAAQGWRVLGLGHAGEVSLSATECSWWNTDVDLASLEASMTGENPPEVILHCAGSGSVAASWNDPVRDFARTVATTAAVVEAMRRHVPRALLVFPSSAAVYGAASTASLAEMVELRPASPYGLHKHLAEQLCFGAHRLWGLRVAVVRLFSLYGPGLRKQLPWDIVRRLVRGENHLALDGCGQEVRDFFHVEDAVRLFRQLTEMDSFEEPVVVNGGTGVATSVADMARLLIRAFRGRDDVRLVFSGHCRQGDPPSLVADTCRLERLGFRARIGIAQGVEEYINSLPAAMRLQP